MNVFEQIFYPIDEIIVKKKFWKSFLRFHEKELEEM